MNSLFCWVCILSFSFGFSLCSDWMLNYILEIIYEFLVCFSFSPNVKEWLTHSSWMRWASRCFWMVRTLYFSWALLTSWSSCFPPSVLGLPVSTLPDSRHLCCLKPNLSRGDPECCTCVHYLSTPFNQPTSLWEFFFSVGVLGCGVLLFIPCICFFFFFIPCIFFLERISYSFWRPEDTACLLLLLYL